MFGSLRLLLAAIVVASHIGAQPHGIWIGVSAVVVFFMISGYAMTGLLESRFPAPRFAPRFYLERIIRLAPQYYACLAAAMVVTLYLHWYRVDTNGFVPFGLFSYLTVIPLGLQAFVGYTHTLIMAQASTLGVEITLYVVSPWVLRSRALSWGASCIAIGIFAATDLHFLPSNIYTYYTSPGPMIFYLLGSYVYRKAWVDLSVFTTILTALLLHGWPAHFDAEMLIGMAMGLPVIIGLARFKGNPVDTAFGNASYGCYLGHGTIIMAAQHFTALHAFGPVFQAGLIVLACACGYATFYMFERPTVALRRRLRGAGARTGWPPQGAALVAADGFEPPTKGL